eukprot:364990-Chlamydomonas_euryale.AAC.8
MRLLRWRDGGRDGGTTVGMAGWQKGWRNDCWDGGRAEGVAERLLGWQKGWWKDRCDGGMVKGKAEGLLVWHGAAKRRGHRCAYLVSTDKERKVRVSILPDEPMLGSFEVQSYCLGHEYFVSACTWAAPSAPGAHPMLVTGSGDGTVRLWDAERGRLLDTCVVSEREEEVEADAEADMAAGAGAGDGDATAGSAATAAEGGGAAGSAAATGADSAGEDGDSGEGGDDETDDRVVYGLKCAPVTCVACSRDG